MPARPIIKSQLAEKIKYPLSPQTLKLIERIEAFPEHQRYLIEEIVRQFSGNILE